LVFTDNVINFYAACIAGGELTSGGMTLLRRFLVVAAFALWMGGFTFYSSFAIPAATELLEGGHRAAGFITQRVTQPLNICGVIALVLLLWNMLAGWRVASRTERGWLVGTWVFLVAGEIALIVLHPMLDAKLDIASRRILPATNFDTWHRAYLWISTAQWIAALPLLWFTLAVWRREEKVAA
jgi:hypothetical protein